MTRLTSKKFIEFVNEQFKKFEINDWEAISVINPRHRTDDIEAGACRLIVTIKYLKAEPDSFMSTNHFLCFYTLGQFEEYIKNGYEMYLKFNNRLYRDMEIDVRRVGKKI